MVITLYVRAGVMVGPYRCGRHAAWHCNVLRYDCQATRLWVWIWIGINGDCRALTGGMRSTLNASLILTDNNI